jgi:outer membrane protein
MNGVRNKGFQKIGTRMRGKNVTHRYSSLPGLVLLGVALLTGTASAQLKLAVINTQRAVLETAEMKKAAADLEAKFRPTQQDIDKRTKDLQDIQAKLADASKLSPQEGQELQAQGQMKQRQLQRISEDLQAEVDRERNDILGRGGKRMNEVVGKIAEAKGLDLVVDVGDAIYFKPALDLTDEAIAAYNKQYPLKP